MKVAPAFAAALIAVSAGLAAPGDPRHRFNAADQARARAALLHTSDLTGRGWKASPVDFTQPNPACFVRRYSFADLTLGGQAGTDFTLGALSVEATAVAYASRADEARSWERQLAPGFFLCLAQGVLAGIPGLEIVSVQRRSFPRLHEASYLVRTVFRGRFRGRVQSLHADQIGVRYGRLEAGLAFIGVNSPFSAAEEQRLARLAAGRMPAS